MYAGMVGISIYESFDPHPDPISPKCAHIYTYTYIHSFFLYTSSFCLIEPSNGRSVVNMFRKNMNNWAVFL